MSYSIHITATAERDILRAADYIKFTLKNPTAAEHLLDAATKTNQLTLGYARKILSCR